MLQTYVHVEVMRWVLVGIIGVITGIVAFIISIIDKYLTNFKLSIFETSNDIGAIILTTILLNQYIKYITINLFSPQLTLQRMESFLDF